MDKRAQRRGGLPWDTGVWALSLSKARPLEGVDGALDTAQHEQRPWGGKAAPWRRLQKGWRAAATRGHLARAGIQNLIASNIKGGPCCFAVKGHSARKDLRRDRTSSPCPLSEAAAQGSPRFLRCTSGTSGPHRALLPKHHRRLSIWKLTLMKILEKTSPCATRWEK